MSDIQAVRSTSLQRRVAPSAVAFVVVAVGVYATVWLALDVVKHIVIPIVAVLIAGYVARKVYHFTGKKTPKSGAEHSELLH